MLFASDPGATRKGGGHALGQCAGGVESSLTSFVVAIQAKGAAGAALASLSLPTRPPCDSRA